MNDPLFSIVDTEVFIMNLTVLSECCEKEIFQEDVTDHKGSVITLCI